MSQNTFAALGVSVPVCKALEKAGVAAPFAIQTQVIADVLDGRDVLAKAPTGSGKTLAFAIPVADLIERDDPAPSALVLVPTRELALQVVEAFKPLTNARHLSVAPVYGGVGLERQAAMARKAHILVATPGRLEDLISRKMLSLDEVDILVLDEADRMLDMGFKPAVDRIVKQLADDRQTLFFSATLDGEAGRVATAYTKRPARHEAAAAPPLHENNDVKHRFIPVAHEDRADALVKTLQDEERALALVFVRTKRGADRLSKRLERDGIKAGAIHGDKSQNQRVRALAAFEAGRIDTLVATDVAARGIHVDDVTHVINFDPPEEREGYVHRVGRTGRAGRSGVGITFVTPDQARDMAKIARELHLDREFGASGLVAHIDQRVGGGGSGAPKGPRGGGSGRGGSGGGGGSRGGGSGGSGGSGRGGSGGSGGRGGSGGSSSGGSRTVASAGGGRGRSGGRGR